MASPSTSRLLWKGTLKFGQNDMVQDITDPVTVVEMWVQNERKKCNSDDPTQFYLKCLNSDYIYRI